MKRLSWMKDSQPPGGITTQFVVGAAGESDAEFISGMERLYRKFSLRRIYFSAFEPLEGTPLENAPAAPARREFRLYQSEWLLRVYKFDPKEIHSILDDEGFLPLDKDPKLSIALNNPDRFPVDINTAGEEELLKVPGIGPQTVRRVLEFRQKGFAFKKFTDLLEAGVGRSAFPFLDVGGKTQSRLSSFLTTG
jgi:predicted DNA-binding helix-hairpin-helix protein